MDAFTGPVDYREVQKFKKIEIDIDKAIESVIDIFSPHFPEAEIVKQ